MSFESSDDSPDVGGAGTDDVEPDHLDVDKDQLEAAERELAEARERLTSVPAELIITNHAMGLYELGAIHLSASPPDFAQASVAIDAFAYLVEGLGDRIGDDASTLRDALANIRMAFVQVKSASSDAEPDDESG